MEALQGSTSSSFTKTMYVTGEARINFLITNTSAFTATINLYSLGAATQNRVAPKDFALEAGKTFEVKDIVFNAAFTWMLTTNVAVDYYVWTTPTYSGHSILPEISITTTGGGGSGDSSNIINTYQAGEDLGGNRLVVLLADELFYFDPTDENHYDYILGFTSTAGLTGEDIDVVSFGPLSGFALTAGSVYYADLNGLITDVVPTSGISIKVGTAVDISILFINLYQPIIQI